MENPFHKNPFHKLANKMRQKWQCTSFEPRSQEVLKVSIATP